MSYHKLWFRNTARKLRLLQPYPEFAKIKSLVKEIMPRLITDLEAEGEDLNDPRVWWQALFMDAIILIENSEGKNLTVAVGVQDKWKPAINNHRTICLPTFQTCRQKLGIDQHWLFFTSSKYPYEDDQWIDWLYAQADRDPPESGCILLDVEA